MFQALDLLKKLLFIFPQGRISASKALTHKYFQDFVEEEAKHDEDESPHINLKMAQANLMEYTYFPFDRPFLPSL